MPTAPAPILAVQPPSSASSPAPSFTANLLPVRAQSAYPVDASSRYWNPETVDSPSSAPVETSSQGVVEDGTGSIGGEKVNEGEEAILESESNWRRKNGDGVKVAYFRGRKLLGREIKLDDVGRRGILVSPTNTFLPQSTHIPTPGDPPEDSEGDDEEQPVEILAEVGTFESVMVWDHEKIPGNDDLFLRGLGEEGSRWRAGMHAF